MIKFGGKKLNVVPMKTVQVTSADSCRYQCLKTTDCVSTNVEILSRSGDSISCSLLDTDHFSHPSDFLESNIGDYYVAYVSKRVTF